ncbi:tungsten formylmethanofuran dehydrogenase [Chryseobacterium sp. Leaf180]|uniref:NAD(P)H-dependent flavin oxidoreductase n=1 Tax=Chryseobacterium sp. Leaf180 TaxID=1736289 RepID=UPI0006FE150D|nr:nitronate monooxygenase [Chryseobacterium sp. Leaf180]KQR90874.1 tungsten formylmethanofuran dehydrogenase [Chryseobacterium sp. Leaf180]
MNEQSIKWQNALTKILNLKYPIVQAPMFGVTTPEMVAAASNVGSLGSLSLGDLPAAKCVELIRATKRFTDNPFAVNLFLNPLPEQNESLRLQYLRTKEFLQLLSDQHQLNVKYPEYEEIKLTDYHDQIEAILAEDCKIVSFTFGLLDAASIDLLKMNGTVLIGTATSIEEAIVLEEAGINIICVQGIEAGGHRGSFIGEKIPEIGGLSLLAQVHDKVNVPLIYAGGIYNAKTLLAVRLLGAQGFQIGSLLLGSVESALLEFEKCKLRNASEKDIVLTKSFSGRNARGLKNIFTHLLDNSEHILPYPYQNKITGPLRAAAKLQQNPEFLSIWTGQSKSTYSSDSTADIILRLIEETENYMIME